MTFPFSFTESAISILHGVYGNGDDEGDDDERRGGEGDDDERRGGEERDEVVKARDGVVKATTRGTRGDDDDDEI